MKILRAYVGASVSNNVRCPVCTIAPHSILGGRGVIKLIRVDKAISIWSHAVFTLLPGDSEKPGICTCPLCAGTREVPPEYDAACKLCGPPMFTLADFRWLKDFCAQLGIKE
jgi:hypothetical protein